MCILFKTGMSLWITKIGMYLLLYIHSLCWNGSQEKSWFMHKINMTQVNIKKSD